MNSTSLLIFPLILSSLLSYGKDYQLKSPDGRLGVTISVMEKISYCVTLNNDTIIAPSLVNLVVNNYLNLGKNASVKSETSNSKKDVIYPEVPRKFKQIPENYNELVLKLNNQSDLYFRAYNDGVAFRWGTNFDDSIKVVSEDAFFNFLDEPDIWFPEEKSFHSHQERDYKYCKLSEITSDRFCSTGILLGLEKGIKVYISESDLYDYPGLWLKGNGSRNGLKGYFPGYPLEVEIKSDRNVPVTKYADYLANTSGTRTFPWRLMVITEKDADLLTSELVFLLAKPCKLKETGWIRPGLVAWDWWNDLNIYGVDFKAGVNTDTYRYYIDFASDYGLEYIILDEGWYDLKDVMSCKPEVDLKELIRYGKEKKVDLILWVTWKALDDKMEEAMKYYSALGIKGLKVDFMQRDDQWMVNYYYRVSEMAAKYELLIDFHGAYKPTGLHREYPNVLSFEGVAGLEQNKWSGRANAEHNLTLPFIRMVAGPMDYTPGAMLNGNKDTFKPSWTRPMSVGTRCHELAKYVIYESPLQMLADSPSNYRKEKECMEFLSQVPVIWDDTRVLGAEVAGYIIIARKYQDKWYAGAMTDGYPREFTIQTDFLEEGKYKASIWKDGLNADKYPSDYKKTEIEVDKNSSLDIRMIPGGGWVAIIEKIKN